MNGQSNAARAAGQAQPIQKTIAIPATGEQAVGQSLKVRIRPCHLECWEYEGTRAQLEDENVIPPGTEWPEGVQSLRFDVGRFRYWLRRCRPDGVKGRPNAWDSCDWWCLRCDLIGAPSQAARRILDKRRELADELYLQSPAGRREWEAHWRRVFDARNDKAFQAFKNLFAPSRKKPGRPSKPKAIDPRAQS